MAEIIEADIQIIGNLLQVTPKEPIEDNAQYEIRIKDLRSKDGKSVLDSYSCKVVTELSPSYCKISDVAVLIDTFEVPETTILYYIREASKYADYIAEAAGVSSSEASFAMKEFVKTKCTIDCLLKAYVNKAAGSGIKGSLGEISFENTEKYATSINDLLDDLWKRLKKWEDAIRGYDLEGRAAPQFAVKAKDASSSDSATFTDIVNDNTRTLPVGI